VEANRKEGFDLKIDFSPSDSRGAQLLIEKTKKCPNLETIKGCEGAKEAIKLISREKKRNK